MNTVMMIWKMKNFNRRLYLFFVLFIVAALAFFSVRAAGGSLATDFSDGEVLKLHEKYQTGAIYDRNGVLLVRGAEKTGSEKGLVWSSAQIKEDFEDLLGMDISSGTSSKFNSVAANASVLFGTEDNRFSRQALLNPFQARVGGSLQLTLDAQTQQEISTLIKNYGYDSSNTYVVASDFSSGEILALHGAVFSEVFHPGSVMKPIVAAAGMDITQDVNLTKYTYNCVSGNHTFKLPGGKTFSVQCAGGAYHGNNVGVAGALKYSCNGFFINLLEKLDMEKLLDQLKEWGIGSSFHFQDFMYWDGRFVYEEPGNAETDKSDSNKTGIQVGLKTGDNAAVKNKRTKNEAYLLGAIGQGDCYISPFQVNFLTNAIFNHGVLVEPYEFIAAQSQPGSEWKAVEHSFKKRVCSKAAADKVADLMEGVTKEGTLKNVVMSNWAGKTGTAQLAGEDGLNGLYTVWTTAAYRGDAAKTYSVTVCLDKVDGSYSSVSAGLLARDILQYLL